MKNIRHFALVVAVLLIAVATVHSEEKRPPIAVMETAFNKRADVTSFRDAKAAGYAAIQMHSGAPAQSLGLEIAADPAILASWKAASKQHGVEIISLCAGSLNKCQIWDRDHELAMQIAKQTIDGCHTLGAPVMLFPFFGPSNFQDSDEALEGVAGFMKELLPYAEKKDVVIGIEAPVTTVRVLELLEMLNYPEHLKIYYDTGNLFDKEDIYETIRKYGQQHFCEIHIKAAGSAVVGNGQIDLSKLAKALDAAEYDKWLVYEANRDGRAPVANRQRIEKIVSLRKSGAAACRADTIAPAEFEVSDGFEITVWATTPQLYNPTNFDVDSQGRLWVTESVNYRNFRNEELGLSDPAGDRVVVLEDTDADGTADASHTFVRDPDLIAPLGIAVIGNRVIVSCSPSILIYTDVNGDARFDPKVDTKETFLTGFRGLDHDHSLHSVKVGPDGYWYFNVGNAGAHTVTDKSGWTLRAGSSYAGGSPHLTENTPGRKSDDGRIWVGGVGMRIRPDGTGLEPIGHNFRNAYEEAVTSFGDVFHADNDDPPACRTTWVMEYGNAGFSSADGSRGWMVDQRPGQTVEVAEWRQEDPGTIPAGDVYGFGAPTGVAYCENGCFDSRFPQGLLLVCESARGEVFAYQPRAQGAGFTLERSVFLKLKDGRPKQGWFRPSDVAVGVDGAIYVSDWYDPGVGGHRMSDATASGTIYRIAPKGFTPQIPKLDLSTSQGQIASLMSPAVNVRSLGWQTLREQGVEALPAIRQVLANANPLLAVRGVWLLPYAGDEGLDQLKKLLKHDDQQMRIAAFRALRRAASDETLQRQLRPHFDVAQEQLCADPSPAVRREVALSARDVPWERRREMLAKLADKFDGWDRWYLEAIGIASDGHESEAYQLLVEDSGVDPLKWDRRLAGLAWRLHPVLAIDAITTRVMSVSVSVDDRKQMLTALAFIPDRRAAESMLRIAVDGSEDVKGMAAWWGKNRDTNDWRDFGLGDEFPNPPEIAMPAKWSTPRLDFALAGAPAFTSTGDQVEIDLDVQGAQRLYLVVERVEKSEPNALASGDGRESGAVKPAASAVGSAATTTWVNPRLLGSAGSTSLTTMEWSLAFCNGQAVDATKWDRRIMLTQPILTTADGHSDSVPSIRVQTRSIISYDLTERSFERFQATAHVEASENDTGGDVRFSVYVDRSPTSDSLPEVAKLIDVPGDASHGRALFFSKHLSCASCHSAGGFGGSIGPDLTQIAKKHAPPVLIEGIIKPSAAIATGFETMTVITVEGKVVSGLIVSAGDPVVLKDSQGKHHTIPQNDIEEMLTSKTSMMPELKQQLTAQEIASLVAFLQEMETQ